MCHDNKIFVEFHRNPAMLRIKFRTVIFQGKSEEGLYKIHGAVCSSSIDASSYFFRGGAFSINVSQWHKGLGHPYFSTVKKVFVNTPLL